MVEIARPFRHVETYCVRAGRPESTTTSSARKIDSRRSWVMSTPVKGSRAFSWCIVCHRSSRVKASSAPKGSSRISTSGLWTAPGRARRAGACRPTAPRAACPRSPRARRGQQARAPLLLLALRHRGRHDLQRQHHVLQDRAPFQQHGVLERHADGRARAGFTFSPCSQTSPWSGIISPAISRVSVDLPQPEGPTTAVEAALGNGQVEPVEHRQRAALGLVGVAHVPDRDEGSLMAWRGPSGCGPRTRLRPRRFFGARQGGRSLDERSRPRAGRHR